MFEIKQFPEFSWSFSRHQSVLNCQRKYAYDYYISHNGWLKRNVEPISQHAYRLKKLQHLPMFFGQIAHEIIEQTIKQIMYTKTLPRVETLIEQAREKLNDAYISSKKQYNAWVDKPSRYNMFFDIYYDGKLDAEQVEIYKERLAIIFTNFLNSYTVQQLLTRSEQIKINQTEEFRFLKLHDIKVYIVMDLLYHDVETNKWIIVDWKTGKASASDKQQLALYALYLQQHLGLPLDAIEVRNEYLLNHKHTNTQLEQFDLDSVLDIFNESIRYMKRFQADILTNEPIDLEDFERTEMKEKCAKCNYKEICI